MAAVSNLTSANASFSVGIGPSFSVGSSDIDFTVRTAVGAIVCTLCVLPGVVIVHGSRYHTSKIPVRAALAAHTSWLTQRLLACNVPTWPLALAANLVPFVVTFVWAGTFTPAEPAGCWVYGLAPLLAVPALLFATYAFLSWKLRRFAISGRVVFAVALSLLLLLLLQLLLVVQRPNCAALPRLAEFPHTAMTAIAMALNLMPVSSILFLSLSASAPQQHAPVHAEVKRSVSLALVLIGFRRAVHWPRVQAVASYALSLVLLALYSMMIFLAPAAIADASSGGRDLLSLPHSASGLFSSLTVVLLDGCVCLYVRADLARSSLLPPITLMVACRLALVYTGRFGVSYIFSTCPRSTRCPARDPLPNHTPLGHLLPIPTPHPCCPPSLHLLAARAGSARGACRSITQPPLAPFAPLAPSQSSTRLCSSSRSCSSAASSPPAASASPTRAETVWSGWSRCRICLRCTSPSASSTTTSTSAHAVPAWSFAAQTTSTAMPPATPRAGGRTVGPMWT